MLVTMGALFRLPLPGCHCSSSVCYYTHCCSSKFQLLACSLIKMFAFCSV
ncbi:hypothetical protein Nmel_013522 [Mimus melanotis]